MEAIKQHGQRQAVHIPNLVQRPEALLELLQPGDLLLTLGAGNIVQAGERLLAQLEGGQ